MYAELYCQSNFSFLTGASDPEELVNTAAFLGYEALAITDECSVAGVVRAHAEIRRNRLPLKLIVGSRLVLSDSLTLVLLCPHKQAYTELCRIISNARRRSPKGEYTLAEWDLKSLKHCLALWLPSGKQQQDNHWGDWLCSNFGDRVWIGAQRLLDGLDTQRFEHIEHLQTKFAVPVCACTGALFHHTDRLSVQHALHAIREHTTVQSLGRQGLCNAERSLRPLRKLSKLYPRQWLDETRKIAGLCSFNLQELKYQYPAELVPGGHTATSYLRECVERGIRRRFPGGISQKIRTIIEKELTLIEEQQYEYFFLTIHDIVQFAQQQNILYQGRGSAANSVVCYCLEITAVDPRQINVLFERFISKERDEPPDIDVDFEHQRREEVIQYIYQKYGRERTALAATVICFRFKSAFREVGKALGFAESQLDFVIKNINRRDRVIPWQQQLQQCGLATDTPKVQQLVTLTEAILGFPRHLSQHVGGFVISAGPLYELVPVENAAMAERTVIQWDKDDLESLGLLKVDILALGMLTAIRKSFALINRQFKEEVSIPFITGLGDDRQVFDMLCKADTVGVFQIESRAQMSMLPRLKPRKYYDLVVQIAIVRPGPIQGDMVHPYLLRRHGDEAISYPSDEVKNVLSRTMGVPIFQEQVIQLAMVAAGFSGGEADQLRRAMASWKKNGRLHEFQDKLINGMLERGYSLDFSQRLFEQIKGFAGYGFPESHSASFAVLAYVSAWLKHYFPVEFYVGLLNSWPMGFYTPSQIVQDAQRHHITILPVCINHSGYDHKVEAQGHNKALRLGFRIIKGLSEQSAQEIIKSRPTNGFQSIDEVQALAVDAGDLAALASANAFEPVAGNRYQARWQIMDQQRNLPLFSNSSGYDQQTLLLQPNEVENLLEDYESTSLSVQRHPIKLLAQSQNLSRFCFAEQLSELSDKSVVHIIGCVTGRQSPGTASGVTFVTLEDHTGNINVVVWQATARHQQQAFLKATLLQVDGILERSKEGVTHVIAGKLTDRSDWLNTLSLKSRDFH
ncbi:DNA polymerase III subunit alpha [Alteromonas aestuariivivens]|uniref:Error-prone DNA polymerase n=1 Tax=Alteromonas aestuariivivens TaxID=1938339 RepID=A0A3D8M2J9_9ALTE|nr:error-prone DNA polymerase [Alteromonas aestuariivivens]RDV23937.1 DNA polymerase III subunit alpha [Alteromonas aestuariivivens]